MPRDLLISIPAWGDWYVNACCAALIPSLRAQRFVRSSVRYVIHTDQPQRVAELIPDAELRLVPSGRSDHEKMNACHNEALASARSGEVVILLVADQVLSVETLDFCSIKLSDGRTKAIYCVAPRVLYNPSLVPVGMTARDLLSWGWLNRHSWTEESVFGVGSARYNSVVYFDSGRSVVAHAFHPHPVAVLKDREMRFTNTLDVGLLEKLSPGEIFLVQNCEFSCVEISASDKVIPSRSDSPFGASDVVRWAGWTPSAQRRMFAHRTVLCGSGDDCEDEGAVAEIMAGLNDASPV